MKTGRIAAIGFMGALWFCACGPSLSHTVPDDLLQRLPKKSRRSVFQAETIVTIAVDRKSAIKRDQETTRRDIATLKERLAALEKESSGDSPAAQRARAEIKVLEAQIDFLDRKLEHLELALEVANDELLLARAQFELAKLQLVKKHAIAFDGQEKDFEEQVADIQRYVDKRRRKLQADAAELKREEDRFLEVKKRYFSSVGESAKGWWTE
jgi:chromosome segregation ATPase